MHLSRYEYVHLSACIIYILFKIFQNVSQKQDVYVLHLQCVFINLTKYKDNVFEL